MYHTAKAYDSLTKRRDHCKNSKPFNSTGPRLAPLSISDPKAPALCYITRLACFLAAVDPSSQQLSQCCFGAAMVTRASSRKQSSSPAVWRRSRESPLLSQHHFRSLLGLLPDQAMLRTTFAENYFENLVQAQPCRGGAKVKSWQGFKMAARCSRKCRATNHRNKAWALEKPIFKRLTKKPQAPPQVSGVFPSRGRIRQVPVVILEVDDRHAEWQLGDIGYEFDFRFHCKFDFDFDYEFEYLFHPLLHEAEEQLLALQHIHAGRLLHGIDSIKKLEIQQEALIQKVNAQLENSVNQLKHLAILQEEISEKQKNIPQTVLPPATLEASKKLTSQLHAIEMAKSEGERAHEIAKEVERQLDDEHHHTRVSADAGLHAHKDRNDQPIIMPAKLTQSGKSDQIEHTQISEIGA
ncbi:unnamed protein product [Nesidiocoris tenuis]|uniref:Uncharacterized protein n=1 Tax=Nesidiocoris tenuis TaxID=355587 RepID=A0A6H5G5G7_9HEMI|nr:unnamed protein product [Nesidiocoris tenuis]